LTPAAKSEVRLAGLVSASWLVHRAGALTSRLGSSAPGPGRQVQEERGNHRPFGEIKDFSRTDRGACFRQAVSKCGLAPDEGAPRYADAPKSGRVRLGGTRLASAARRTRRRSGSVPPQMPNSTPCRSARPRHVTRTGHAMQMRFAWSAWRSASPAVPSGKNSSRSHDGSLASGVLLQHRHHRRRTARPRPRSPGRARLWTGRHPDLKCRERGQAHFPWLMRAFHVAGPITPRAPARQGEPGRDGGGAGRCVRGARDRCRPAGPAADNADAAKAAASTAGATAVVRIFRFMRSFFLWGCPQAECGPHRLAPPGSSPV